MNSQINKTRRGARCNTIMIFVLYVVTLFSVLSLHRNIFGDRTLEEADVKALNTKLEGVETLLHNTIKEISRFNRTVTNGEVSRGILR